MQGVKFYLGGWGQRFAFRKMAGCSMEDGRVAKGEGDERVREPAQCVVDVA